ncbi:MAG TPA: hypothetical protein VKD22_18005 [Ramlibacter sp.]|nr:hypothetical protein [Ramlibacter sp.]
MNLSVDGTRLEREVLRAIEFTPDGKTIVFMSDNGPITRMERNRFLGMRLDADCAVVTTRSDPRQRAPGESVAQAWIRNGVPVTSPPPPKGTCGICGRKLRYYAKSPEPDFCTRCFAAFAEGIRYCSTATNPAGIPPAE